MKPMICECCGASINRKRMICEYCGTSYKDDSIQRIMVENYQNPCRVLASRIEIPIDQIKIIGSEKASDFAVKQLSRNLAEAIAPLMTLEAEYHPMTNAQIVTAKVRIVEPEYMF